MQKRLKSATVMTVIFDLIGAVFLGLYALIIGPLGALRGPLVFERVLWYLWVLAPQGLVARSVRTAIDWRLGNFDAAIAQLEGIVCANEDYFKAKSNSPSRRRVLEDLYTVLVRTHLHAGHIDDAMLVIIRAKKCLAIDRLSGLSGIDAKTAHLVRAGLSAGRLLDGSGLATMFVKAPPQPAPRPAAPATAGSRQGASRNGELDQDKASTRLSKAPDHGQSADAKDGESGGAKVIPLFPS